MAADYAPAPALYVLDPTAAHAFQAPIKRINDGHDVDFFLASKAYADILTFIFQLNTSMLPRRTKGSTGQGQNVKAWKLHDPDVPFSPVVQNLGRLLDSLTAIVKEAPPDPGPRRFGNISFRTWHDIVHERLPGLLDEYLPAQVLQRQSISAVSAKAELEAYLVGSFGSSQRLDYGTGHELSFLAFLGCLWKLGAFPASEDGEQERGLILGVIEPYLVLIRLLIRTYTLEPAGSHGVWGLDDHSFVPYIFGSAQLSPPIISPADVVTEGSLAHAPDPADVAKIAVVDRERSNNLYFSAIGFIYDVKKGPFWEHSPILYDISGIKAGWAKINKGMIKMYNAEVLSKFPVVQHFPFGSLFSWEHDPNAGKTTVSVHTSSQPNSTPPGTTARFQQPLRDPHAVKTTSTSGIRLLGPRGISQSSRTSWAPNVTTLPPSGNFNLLTSAPGAMQTAIVPSEGSTPVCEPSARLGTQAVESSANAPSAAKGSTRD
ncbi:Serine/threonine-protein phosphatase 2A activator 1 [Coniothyrium glycines]